MITLQITNTVEIEESRLLVTNDGEIKLFSQLDEREKALVKSHESEWIILNAKALLSDGEVIEEEIDFI